MEEIGWSAGIRTVASYYGISIVTRASPPYGSTKAVYLDWLPFAMVKMALLSRALISDFSCRKANKFQHRLAQCIAEKESSGQTLNL